MELKRSAISEISTKNWTFQDDLVNYAEYGFGGIGVWRDKIEGMSVNEVVSLVTKFGLKITNLCFGGMFTFDSSQQQALAVEDTKRALELSKELAAGCLLVVSGPILARQPEKSMSLIKRCLDQVLHYAEEIDAKIALEAIHPMDIGQWSAIVTLRQVKELITEYRSPYMGFLLDVYNSWWDPDLPTIIKDFSSNIFGVHLADWRQPTRSPVDRAVPGRGIIPLKTIVGLLEKSGYQGFYDLELFSEELWHSDYHTVLSEYVQWVNSLGGINEDEL